MRDSIADPKYEGVKTSRNQLLTRESEEEDEREEVEGGGGSSGEDHEGPITPMDGAVSSESEVEDDEDQEIPFALSNEALKSKRRRDPSPHLQAAALDASRHQDQTLTSSLRDTRAADKLKGKAVARQLVRLTVTNLTSMCLHVPFLVNMGLPSRCPHSTTKVGHNSEQAPACAPFPLSSFYAILICPLA